MVDISKFLSHLPPFLMVDKVLSIDNNYAVTSFKIKEDNVFVENSFFNEVDLVVFAAQTYSPIVGESYFDDDIDGTGTELIADMEEVFFKKLKKAIR